MFAVQESSPFKQRREHGNAAAKNKALINQALNTNTNPRFTDTFY